MSVHLKHPLTCFPGAHHSHHPFHAHHTHAHNMITRHTPHGRHPLSVACGAAGNGTRPQSRMMMGHTSSYQAFSPTNPPHTAGGSGSATMPTTPCRRDHRRRPFVVVTLFCLPCKHTQDASLMRHDLALMLLTQRCLSPTPTHHHSSATGPADAATTPAAAAPPPPPPHPPVAMIIILGCHSRCLSFSLPHNRTHHSTPTPPSLRQQ